MGEPLELVSYAVGEARCDALIEHLDAMRQKSMGVVEREGPPVSLGKRREALTARHVFSDRVVVERKLIQGNGIAFG